MSTTLPATANATSANPPTSEVEEGSEETKEGNGESRESIMDQMRDHKVDKADKKRDKMLEDLDNTRLYYIIDPDTTSKQVWDVVVLLMVVVNLFTIPISMAAQFDNTPSPIFSTFVDVLFVADLFVTFFTAYNLTNGERIWQHRMIVNNYVYSGWFFIDFVACVPWEMFAAGGSEDGGGALKYTLIVRALKLPRLLRLGKVFKYLNRFKYAQAWKIIRLLMIMIISAHWTGCLYFFLCEVQSQQGDGGPWCNVQDDVRGGTGSERLLIAFHTAFLMLIGENIEPTTSSEYAYTAAAMLIGQIISAVVIGNISIVLNNQASMSALYTNKMDRVNESMMTLKLPNTIQVKIRQFFELMWNRHRVLASDETFRYDLNPSLKGEIDLFLNRDLVVGNPIFHNVSASLLMAIVTQLKNQVYLKSDYLIRKGAFGSEMFFLQHGKAGARIKGKIVKEYNHGESFGEMALISKDGGRRKCDVVAISNVDLRVLTRHIFNRLASRYPELKARLKEQTKIYENKKVRSRFKGATTVLANKGIAGLFSKKEEESTTSTAKKSLSSMFSTPKTSTSSLLSAKLSPINKTNSSVTLPPLAQLAVKEKEKKVEKMVEEKVKEKVEEKSSAAVLSAVLPAVLPDTMLSTLQKLTKHILESQQQTKDRLKKLTSSVKVYKRIKEKEEGKTTGAWYQKMRSADNQATKNAAP